MYVSNHMCFLYFFEIVDLCQIILRPTDTSKIESVIFLFVREEQKRSHHQQNPTCETQKRSHHQQNPTCETTNYSKTKYTQTKESVSVASTRIRNDRKYCDGCRQQRYRWEWWWWFFPFQIYHGYIVSLLFVWKATFILLS